MTKPRVLIIGAGVAGLCMAYALDRAAVPFTIFEKAAELGGTWRDNVYPGSGCDVPSHLYCYSFHPNPEYSRAYADQSEILSYLRGFATHHGLLSKIRFGTEVAAARFDDRRRLWVVRTTAGAVHEFDVVVTATGQLNQPSLPDVPGLSSFAGSVFHSARWKVGHDLRGERVAVVGSGASAVQIVPQIAPIVSRLHVFQRTPNWIMPKPDHAYSPRMRGAFRRILPLLRLERYLIYWGLEPRFVALRQGSRVGKLVQAHTRRWMESEIADPALRQKLVPAYPIGCKRILISNDYLATLQRPGVELVTESIARVTRDAIVTHDGTARPVDTIVLATGFRATEFLAPMEIEGRGGVSLREAWRNGPEAYLGMAVTGFPNLFMLYGPNTNLGHNSIIFMIECQVRYITKLIAELSRGHVRTLDVRADRMALHNAFLQEKLAGSVWNAGCRNWYMTGEGKQTNNWPSFTVDYWRRTRRPQISDFERTVVLAGVPARPPVASPAVPAYEAVLEG